MKSIQTYDDFDHAIDGGYYNTIWDTPVAVSTPRYRTQPKSLYLPTTGAENVGVRHLISGSPTKGWHAFAFRIDAAPSNDVGLAWIVDAAGTPGRLAVGPNPNLYVYIGGGSVQVYDGNPILVDTWYWIEFIYDVNDGTGDKKLYWRVNDVDQATATLTSAASTITHAQLFTAAGDASLDWYASAWHLGSAASTSDWMLEPSATREHLSGPTVLTGSPVTQFTPDTSRGARIEVIDVSNPSGSPVDFSLSIGADAAGTRLFDGLSIPADSSQKFQLYQIVDVGEPVQAFAGTAGVLVLTIDGTAL